MDINEQDRAALRVNRCPDCSHPISLEVTGPWCRHCDVWFEFNISGWVIRNRDAARFYTLLKAAKQDRKAASGNEAAHRDSREEFPMRNAGLGDDRKRFGPKPFQRPKSSWGSAVRFYARNGNMPVSLYSWLLK